MNDREIVSATHSGRYQPVKLRLIHGNNHKKLQNLLKTRIKADRITNLTDARYFSARGVSWLGFQLDAGGEGQVSPQMFSAIKEWIEGPVMVGVFGTSTADEINNNVELLGLDAVQVGLFTSDDEIKDIRKVPVIKEIVIQNLKELETLNTVLTPLKEIVELVLLNFDKNGISWQDLQQNSEALQQLSHFCANFNIIISIVSKPDEIVEIMNKLQPQGFNFTGSEEEKVGFKSYEEMDEIFDLLELED